MKYLLITLCLTSILFSCDTSKMSKTPDDQFIGDWVLRDRGRLDGIEIEISKDEKGNFSGLITKLNDDKYVTLFMEEGDKIVSEIKRNSNFEFVLSEKKIAAPLFSAYGQGTTAEFSAKFQGKDTILLGNNGADGAYIRKN